MAKAERQARKAALEASIQQQRLDLLVEAEHWHRASRPLEASWQAVQRYRLPALGGGSLLLWWSLRHPATAKRLARRSLSIMVIARRAQWLRRLLP
ncbi:YqjK family protein [Halomonas borealis]|uniref:YqjK family protein n=1 Tax=Halomonas borealis TaxID=2508710 RepID=UPI00109F9EB9|nr:YqjK family protein [Halomonas borealis]